MSILVPVLAFAFCIWLTVRIINRREHWAKRTLETVVLALPVLYVLSFGPACWWFTSPSHKNAVGLPGAPKYYASGYYWPIGWLSAKGPTPLTHALAWYATRRYDWDLVPTDFAEQEFTDLWRQ